MNVTGTPFTCLHPKLVVNPYTHEKINAPCGQCAACQSRKAARYETQIQLEAKNSFAVMFVTLTFANSHIPLLKAVPVLSESGFAENEYAFFDSATQNATDYFALGSGRFGDAVLNNSRLKLSQRAITCPPASSLPA